MKKTQSTSAMRSSTASAQSSQQKQQQQQQQQPPTGEHKSRIDVLYQVKNPKEKYTQSQSKLYSRMLDNHVHKPHDDPWLANGITPAYKYNYNDSGLGYQMKDKYQEKLNKTREKIAVMREKKDVSSHPELKDIRSGEVVVIIEFCSDCDSHQGSTRHDEQMYSSRASSLRQAILRHFPTAKAIMKPIRADPNASAVEKLTARQKIGAFEVSVGSSQDSTAKKVSVHSKLASKKWGNESEIIDEIGKYMGTTTLSFSLNLPFFDVTSISQESLTNAQENKLYQVKVQLFPRRFYDENGNPISSQPSSQQQYGNTGSTTSNGQNRPMSGMSRPMSGMSSSQSAANLSNNRGMGSQQQQHSMPRNGSQSNFDAHDKSRSSKAIVAQTDVNGIVVFKDIPVDTYWVEINETNNYRRLSQLVNIFELMKDKAPLDIDLQLQNFNKSFVTFKATYVTQKDQINEHPIMDGIIKISALPSQQEQQETQQPILIVEEKFNKELKITLDPGMYLIQIEKSGYSTLEENRVEILPGDQEFSFSPVTRYIDEDSKQPMDSKSRFQNRPSSSARRGILKTTEKDNTSTRQNGNNYDNANGNGAVGSHTMKTNEDRDDMLSSSGLRIASSESPKQRQSIRPTSNSTQQSKNVTVKEDNPVVNNHLLAYRRRRLKDNLNDLKQTEKITDEWSFQKVQSAKERDENQLKAPKTSNELKLTGFCSTSIIAFKVITPEEELVTESNDTIVIQNDINKSNKIGLWIQKTDKYESGVFRIYATVMNPQQFNAQALRMHASQKSSNTFLQIPYLESSHLSMNSGTLSWDIGIFDVKTQRFFEINNVTTVPITRDWLLGEYESLLRYLNGSRPGPRHILGFESKESINYEDDQYVKLDCIIEKLKSYEYIMSPEQAHFLQSAATPNKFYSFKKLQLKLIHKDLHPQVYSFIPQVLTAHELGQSDDENDYARVDDSENEEEMEYYEDSQSNDNRILANPRGGNILNQ